MNSISSDGGFAKFLARRSPAVRERILRLNPKPESGELLRGWHPHKRAQNWYLNMISKGEVIRREGREAWAALPRICIVHDGHRKAIRHEDFRDQLWRVPADHPLRRATRVNGEWVIPPRVWKDYVF